MVTTMLKGRNNAGFTLLEIMITILVIGIITAIAAPAWLKSRRVAQAKACWESQDKVDGAISRWALENRKTDGDDCPRIVELVGNDRFIKNTPLCPAEKHLINTPLKIGDPVECPDIEEYPWHKKGSQIP